MSESRSAENTKEPGSESVELAPQPESTFDKKTQKQLEKLRQISDTLLGELRGKAEECEEIASGKKEPPKYRKNRQERHYEGEGIDKDEAREKAQRALTSFYQARTEVLRETMGQIESFMRANIPVEEKKEHLKSIAGSVKTVALLDKLTERRQKERIDEKKRQVIEKVQQEEEERQQRKETEEYKKEKRNTLKDAASTRENASLENKQAAYNEVRRAYQEAPEGGNLKADIEAELGNRAVTEEEYRREKAKTNEVAIANEYFEEANKVYCGKPKKGEHAEEEMEALYARLKGDGLKLKKRAVNRMLAEGVRIDRFKVEPTPNRVARGVGKIGAGAAVGGAAGWWLGPVAIVPAAVGAVMGGWWAKHEIGERGNRVEVPLENGQKIQFEDYQEFIDWCESYNDRVDAANPNSEIHKLAKARTNVQDNADGSPKREATLFLEAKEEWMPEEFETTREAAKGAVDASGLEEGVADKIEPYVVGEMIRMGYRVDEAKKVGWRRNHYKIPVDFGGAVIMPEEDWKAFKEWAKDMADKRLANEAKKRKEFLQKMRTRRASYQAAYQTVINKATGEEESPAASPVETVALSPDETVPQSDEGDMVPPDQVEDITDKENEIEPEEPPPLDLGGDEKVKLDFSDKDEQSPPRSDKEEPGAESLEGVKNFKDLCDVAFWENPEVAENIKKHFNNAVLSIENVVSKKDYFGLRDSIHPFAQIDSQQSGGVYYQKYTQLWNEYWNDKIKKLFDDEFDPKKFWNSVKDVFDKLKAAWPEDGAPPAPEPELPPLPPEPEVLPSEPSSPAPESPPGEPKAPPAPEPSVPKPEPVVPAQEPVDVAPPGATKQIDVGGWQSQENTPPTIVGENQGEGKEQGIENAQSFDELEMILREKGKIGKYSAEVQIKRISTARNEIAGIKRISADSAGRIREGLQNDTSIITRGITEEEGLRKTVNRLLVLEIDGLLGQPEKAPSSTIENASTTQEMGATEPIVSVNSAPESIPAAPAPVDEANERADKATKAGSPEALEGKVIENIEADFKATKERIDAAGVNKFMKSTWNGWLQRISANIKKMKEKYAAKEDWEALKNGIEEELGKINQSISNEVEKQKKNKATRERMDARKEELLGRLEEKLKNRKEIVGVLFSPEAPKSIRGELGTLQEYIEVASSSFDANWLAGAEEAFNEKLANIDDEIQREAVVAIPQACQALGITEGDNKNQADKKYKKLANQYHPDKNPGNEEAAEKFKEITRYWNILELLKFQEK